MATRLCINRSFLDLFLSTAGIHSWAISGATLQLEFWGRGNITYGGVFVGEGSFYLFVMLFCNVSGPNTNLHRKEPVLSSFVASWVALGAERIIEALQTRVPPLWRQPAIIWGAQVVAKSCFAFVGHLFGPGRF